MGLPDVVHVILHTVHYLVNIMVVFI